MDAAMAVRSEPLYSATRSGEPGTSSRSMKTSGGSSVDDEVDDGCMVGWDGGGCDDMVWDDEG